MKPLIVIAGATATGKSKTAVRLAKLISGEVISADSMQVYKGLDIGTAKITEDEKQGVKHHLIDVAEPGEEFNVFKYKALADACIEEIHSKNKVPILVGGTGFYIQAVLNDIDFSLENDMQYRAELEQLLEENGSGFLHDMLKEADPAAALEIHPNNAKRVIRALEFFHNTGKRISEHNAEQRTNSSPYDFLFFVLNRDRALLYEDINKRVDAMMEEGLVDEVKGLIAGGAPVDSIAMQGLGYHEIGEYLKGSMDLEEAVRLIKQNTRHYAKRQITWFKREKDAIWLDIDKFNSIDDIVDLMVNRFYEL